MRAFVKTYVTGNEAVLSAVFHQPGCSPVYVDPDTVTLRVKDPSGNTTAYVYGTDVQVVQDSAGHYHANIDIDDAGTWYYRWEGDGSYKAAAEGTFTVAAGNFAGSP